ncbi:universal stress protein [uncultured Algibacter sp.]|uniref:universal stress protein n=1 Tax=uncultured Algibacter sp. TaxID=298659 RepID=UPI00261643C8|nr:universal stress protein [uncultured Algibacter sp.]
MKKNKYKILVLSDLKKSTDSILKSTVSLANIIEGDIEFFHVKKPLEVVNKENQLSAIRTINDEYITSNKAIKKLVKPISEAYSLKLNYKVVIGNLKDEISKRIKAYKPDIIILGKRKQKLLGLGDKTIKFVFENFKGAIMVASDKNFLEPNKNLLLGVLNSNITNLNTQFVKDLLEHTQKPLKEFHLGEESSDSGHNMNTIKTVKYVFDKGSNTIQNLSNYLEKSNVNLLYLDRNNKGVLNELSKPELYKVINKLNVSLLVA